MKLLLDTHIWLWYALGDPQLSKNLQSTIASDTTELWLSPISIWEVLLLAEKGRISLQLDTITWIDQSIKALAICEAPLNRHIAVLSRQVDLLHKTLLIDSSQLQPFTINYNWLPSIPV